MQEMYRKSSITLPLPQPTAASVGQATYTSARMQRITRIQLCLSDTGTGAGSTNVNVKVNGTQIHANNALSIAGAAGTKTVTAQATAAAGSVPPGTRLNSGDVVTVDVASVPGTTTPAAAFVVLDIVELDV